MPIDIQQFKEAAKPVEVRVLEFLSKEPKKAYSLMEIGAALEGYAPDQFGLLILVEKMEGQSKTWERYSTVLASLVSQKKVEQVEYQGTTYYAAVKP